MAAASGRNGPKNCPGNAFSRIIEQELKAVPEQEDLEADSDVEIIKGPTSRSLRDPSPDVEIIGYTPPHPDLAEESKIMTSYTALFNMVKGRIEEENELAHRKEVAAGKKREHSPERLGDSSKRPRTDGNVDAGFQETPEESQDVRNHRPPTPKVCSPVFLPLCLVNSSGCAGLAITRLERGQASNQR